MTPEQTKRLATILREKRLSLELSASEVARRAGVNVGTVWRIEEGQIASPKAESLAAIGSVLDIPVTDLFTSVGWMPEDELPTLTPYLRTKYGSLPPEALADIQAHFKSVAQQYGVSFDPTAGPQHKEDE